jgi:plasmid stabilization system protein ParE
MPEIRLRVHPAVAAELEAAVQWYAARSPRATGAFVWEVNTCIERVRDAPHRWPRDVHSTHRYLLPFFPFRLVYQVQNRAIDLVAVAHGGQRPGDWRSRSRAKTPSHPDAHADGICARTVNDPHGRPHHHLFPNGEDHQDKRGPKPPWVPQECGGVEDLHGR